MNLRPVVALMTFTCVLVYALAVAGQPAASKDSESDGKATADARPADRPRSPKARSARQRLDAAMNKADEAWRQAALAAHRQYVRDMEEALKIAGSAGKADEVALIAAALTEGKEKLAELEKRKRSGGAASAATRAGRVLANKGWQPVLKVKKGQVLNVTAKGEWIVSTGRGLRFGPAGGGEEHEGQPLGMLLARLGNRVYPIGEEAEITVPASGLLEMMCNDAEGHREDNVGHLEVTITIE